MKVVHKFSLPVNGAETALELKAGYTIVHSEYVLVEKAVFIWVEEPLAASIPKVKANLKVVKSGDPVKSDAQHISTAVDTLAPEAYHIYYLSQQEVLEVEGLSRESREVEAA
jgi:hypothetical protein